MTPTTRTTYPRPRQLGVVIALQLATLLVAAGPAAPVTYILPSDESMVDRTATIVFGRVLSAAPAPDGLRLPATDFTVQVEEVLKGHVASSTIVVRQPGGAGPGGLMMRIPGLPMLQEGERVLLFVADQSSGEESGGGIYRTVELALGIFFEVQVEGGALLEREPSLREDVLETAAGASAEALAGLRDGDLFRRWIRDRASNVRRAADYFVPEQGVVRGPVTVRQPYRFSRTGETSSCSTTPSTRGESWDRTVARSGGHALGPGATSHRFDALRRTSSTATCVSPSRTSSPGGD